MLRLAVLALTLVIAGVSTARAADDDTLGPDSQRLDNAPRGKVARHSWINQVFEGTVRAFWIYVPARYAPTTSAAAMVFQDGKNYVNKNG